MATNQQNPDGEVQTEYAKSKQQLQAINHEVKELQAESKKIDARLSSWGLATMETIGLAVDDVTDDSHLHILANEKLSRNDLARKDSLIRDRLEELAGELRSQYAIIRQLKVDAKVEKARLHGEYVRRQQEEVVREFYADPHVAYSVWTSPSGFC